MYRGFKRKGGLSYIDTQFQLIVCIAGWSLAIVYNCGLCLGGWRGAGTCLLGWWWGGSGLLGAVRWGSSSANKSHLWRELAYQSEDKNCMGVKLSCRWEWEAEWLTSPVRRTDTSHSMPWRETMEVLPHNDLCVILTETGVVNQLKSDCYMDFEVCRWGFASAPTVWTLKMCRLKQHPSKDQASSMVLWEYWLSPQPGDRFIPDMNIYSDEDPGRGDGV